MFQNLEIFLKLDETCLKIVETCSNMVMFILVSIVYNDDFDDWKNGV